ncbi:hypothetical protein I4U23_022014 [Adineta vaga]|nr:hypothetical protein I4U23_022014 [Adineta vaga]
MSTTIFPLIQQIITQYFMSTIFIMGLIGNIFCCILFFKQFSTRLASSIYFFTLSLFANMYLIWSTIPIFYALNNADLQIISLIYCKMRLYLSHVFGLYTRYLIVFACIDLYLFTHINIRIRSFSSMKIAFCLIIFMCIFGLIIGSHILIFLDIRANICGLFDFYKFFYPIYQFITIVVLSSILMSIFGFLAVRNLRQRQIGLERIKRKDRDLIRMLIAEILINIIASIPFAANLLYNAATSSTINKTIERIQIDAFLNFFSQFLFISPFYLFIIVSKSFRREFIQLIHKYIRRQNRVTHINGLTTH